MTLPPIVVNELEKQSGLILIEPSDASINTLIEQIKLRTGELISINTVKRLLGRVDDGNRQPRISTLNTIARYLGRSGWTPLLLELSNGSSSFSPIEGELQTQDLQPDQIVEVAYLPDRLLQFLYLGDGLFEVALSQNSKLQTSDTGQIAAFIKNFPLIVRQVERHGMLISPSYTAGRISGLTSVKLLQQKS